MKVPTLPHGYDTGLGGGLRASPLVSFHIHVRIFLILFREETRHQCSLSQKFEEEGLPIPYTGYDMGISSLVNPIIIYS